MQEFSATKVKGHWGEISDAAMREPVAITKHGRPALVVTSIADYEELHQLRLAHLQQRVQQGFEELERGDHEPLDMDAIKAKARHELANTRQQNRAEN